MDLEQFMFPCLSKTLFGIECLGCGFQRSLAMLLQGDFSGSFRMYPALLTTFFFLAIVGLNFVDNSRNYKKLLLFSAFVNGAFMVVGYFVKHYY